MKSKIDVCLTSESKIGKSFQNQQQFKVNRYKMTGRERDF